MAYTGSANLANPITTGVTSSNDLSRDVYIETLEAFNRTLVALPLVRRQTIASGNAGQFIIGGKTSDSTDPATYARGTQVDITDAEFDERTIILARPVYEAKRVDQFEEKVAHYDIRTIITNQMGEALANKVDRMVFDEIFKASSGTGLASNPSAVALSAIAYGAAANAVAKGNLLADAIFDAAAVMRENDVSEELFVAVSPTEYSNIVRSDRAVNADFTNGNGGFDSGKVMRVGGVTLVQSNNVAGTKSATTTAKLLGLVFSSEAVGVLELIGMTTNQEKQIDFLDATLMTAYYANGMGVLRPECAVAIMDT